MQTTGNGLIQAVEWKKGSYGVGAGQYKSVRVLHCIEDGDVTAHFPDGNDTVTFTAGDDVTLAGIDIAIVSGKFAIN